MMQYAPWYLSEALEFLSDHGYDCQFADLADAEYALAEVQDTLRESSNCEVTHAALIPE